MNKESLKAADELQETGQTPLETTSCVKHLIGIVSSSLDYTNDENSVFAQIRIGHLTIKNIF